MSSSFFSQLDRRMVLFSVVLYVGLGIPISLLHEMGHVAVCAASSFDYRVWLDATGGHTLCFGRLDQNFIYNAMGGLFGLAGSGALIASWFFAKRYYALLAVGLAYAVDQGAKVVIEGMLTQLYLSGIINVHITALQVAAWFGFMLYFAHKSYVAKQMRAA